MNTIISKIYYFLYHMNRFINIELEGNLEIAKSNKIDKFMKKS